MSQLNWSDESSLASARILVARTTNGPTDDVSKPHRPGELVFNKLEQDDKRYLNIVAADDDGDPIHFVLDRDGIERLRKFLA